MTQTIFIEWFERFYAYVARKNGRKVVFLLANCSAHCKLATFPKIDHVEIIFLPPNTTSGLQPMDAGIIVSVKRRHCRRQISRALHNLDPNTQDIYKVDQLTCMNWMRTIWDELQDTIVHNYWRSTKQLDSMSGIGDLSDTISKAA